MTTTSTIAEQVASYHRASAGQLPAQAAGALAAEQRALAAAGEPSGAAQPGTRLPDGELLDAAGQPTTLGLDLTQVNADGTTALPMPAVLIADADGAIRWIDVHPDYTTTAEPGQVLQAVTETIA